jgi:hypothetical protein
MCEKQYEQKKMLRNKQGYERDLSRGKGKCGQRQNADQIMWGFVDYLNGSSVPKLVHEFKLIVIWMGNHSKVLRRQLT